MPQTIANGARFHFRLEGDPTRTPVVLVHALGADHGLWDKVVPHLTEWACVLRYDLRGHGGSETTEGDYSLELMASDLLALASHVGFDRFSVVGVSLGALTAAEAAAKAAHRVKSIALCSAAVRIAPPPGGWDGRARLVRQDGMAPLGQPMVERMFSKGFREAQDPAVETMRSTLLHTDREGYASACAVLRDADMTPIARQVTQPALVLSGELDPLTPPSAGRALAEMFPAGRHVELPGGHFPPLECPAELVGELQKAFEGW